MSHDKRVSPHPYDRLTPDVIIAAVARVQEVASAGIPPTTHAADLTNVFREDVVIPPIGADAALDQAPAAELGRFRVPRILADEEDGEPGDGGGS